MKKILLLLLLIPTFCIAKEWDGIASDYDWYNNNDGDTYYIRTPEELKGFSNIVSALNMPYDNFEGKTIILKNDINLNNHLWIPIGDIKGSTNYGFKGVFDGKNHMISCLRLESKNQQISYSGFFASNDGVIKNLKLRGITTDFNLYPSSAMSLSFGFIVGTNWGTISNCDVVCSIYFIENSTSSITNTPIIGGIAGENYGSIETSSYSGDIAYIVNKANIGGIAGVNYQDGSIQQCKSNSNIKIHAGEFTNIGGITSNSYGKIKNCMFTGLLQANSKWSMLGGICFSGNVENCISTGSIIGEGTYNNLSAITSTVGGAINCYYVGTLTNAQGEGNNISFQELINRETYHNFSYDIWMFTNGETPSLQSSKQKYLLNIKSGIQGNITIPMYASESLSLTIKSENKWKIYSVNVNNDITYVSSDTYIVSLSAFYSDTDIEVIYFTEDTNVHNDFSNKYGIHGENNNIVITGLNSNEQISVYSNNGSCLYKTKSNSNICTIPMSNSGIYIIKIGDFTAKIAI